MCLPKLCSLWKSSVKFILLSDRGHTYVACAICRNQIAKERALGARRSSFLREKAPHKLYKPIANMVAWLINVFCTRLLSELEKSTQKTSTPLHTTKRQLWLVCFTFNFALLCALYSKLCFHKNIIRQLAQHTILNCTEIGSTFTSNATSCRPWPSCYHTRGTIWVMLICFGTQNGA